MSVVRCTDGDVLLFLALWPQMYGYRCRSHSGRSTLLPLAPAAVVAASALLSTNRIYDSQFLRDMLLLGFMRFSSVILQLPSMYTGLGIFE